MLLFSCENQFVNESEIQRAILQDEDFVTMMSEVFLSEYANESNSYDNRQLFKSYFKILEERHSDFFENMQLALNQKTTKDYISFAGNLSFKVLEAQQQSAKINVVYDGGSVCGLPSCGSSIKDGQSLACITGALASAIYCVEMNMVGDCTAMKDSAVAVCCAVYCTPPVN